MAAEATGRRSGSEKTTALLERDRELDELTELLRAAAGGSGGVALIEGPAGIGKSRLLTAAADRARVAGFQVLRARAGELERELGWGVVRELLAPPVSDPADRAELLGGAAALAEPVLAPRPAAGEAARGEPVAAELAPDGALHGLYWLTSNLAQRRPLALFVDDAHWADAPSLRWLSYLGARIEDLPALLVLASRGEDEANGPPIASLVATARVVAPPPLSEAASAELIGSVFEAQPEAEFAHQCFEATGGNPFLLRELALALRREGARPHSDDAPRVGLARPETISRAVLLRLSRLAAPASELARAVAVLGTEASLTDAAALAGLAEDEAARLADTLASAHVLSPALPLRFAHPIVRSVLYEEIPPVTRTRLHERAARLLTEAGAEAEIVAIHLLATEPRGDEEKVVLLRRAAKAASVRGAPESAMAYLRRARREGRGQKPPAELLHELGAAEAWAGEPEAAIETLTEAITMVADARGPTLAALDLGRALLITGRFSEAARVLQEAAEALPPDDRELAIRLQAELIATARLDPGSQQLVRDQLALHTDVRGVTPGERLLLASVAFDRAWRGANADEIAELAERALAGGRLVEEHSSDIPALYEAVFVLLVCDRFEQAHSALGAALDDARRRGSAFAFFTASAFRCLANCWGGSVSAAEADGRLAVKAALRYGSPLGIVFSYLIDTLIARGALDDAQEVLAASGIGEEIPDDLVFNSVLYQRARLRLALGDSDAGLADLFEVGRRLAAAESDSLTAAFSHRSLAAEVLAARGERAQARELTGEELRLARDFGGTRAIGMALRGAGVVEGGERGLELLREAVAILEPPGSPLERSRAMVDLGAALRRAGWRAEARDQLSLGLDVAYRCGALAIERRARDELRLVGGRPRRDRLSGPESLTASEFRVAKMAANGMANREIAEQLFVSLRTVETHLTHAYGKLEIKSRRELGDALGTVTQA